MANKIDVYTEVTNKIIEKLESGYIPWVKAWACGGFGKVSHATGKPYSLLNQFLLPADGEYLTFNQIQEAGGKVRKGEKASFVVFWKWLEKVEEVENENGETETVTRKIPYLKKYPVFHISQCDGVNPKYAKPVEEHNVDPLAMGEAIIAHYIDASKVAFNACLSNEAYYQPVSDSITVPRLSQYENANEYYSTTFHEMVHSTGHASRLNRKLVGNTAKNRDDYSKEELVAEIGSCMLCNVAGIATEDTDRNSAGYVQGWLKALKNDKKLIVTASAQAEKACDFILDGFELEPTPDNDPEKGSKGEKVNKSVNTALKSLLTNKKNAQVYRANTMFEVDGATYACNGHVLAKTSEKTEYRRFCDYEVDDNAKWCEDMLKKAENDTKFDVAIPSYDDLKQAVKAFKAEKGCKKVIYTLDCDGHTMFIDANYLLTVLRIGCTSARGSSVKTPLVLHGATCDAMVLPINMANNQKIGAGEMLVG